MAMEANEQNELSAGIGGSSAVNKPTFVERMVNKPAEIKLWWTNLCAVFPPSFLILIGAVYFCQGLGGFAVRCARPNAQPPANNVISKRRWGAHRGW
jgi:hypothetical protein